MSSYLITYDSMEERNVCFEMIKNVNNSRRFGIICSMLPIIGNLSVMENIMLPASYHFGMTYADGEKLILSDLRKYNMEHILDKRPSELNDFQKIIAKYLQILYMKPDWIVFLSPRRMYAAEFEDRFHDFLRYEVRENSVIIDHKKHAEMFMDLTQYTEIGFQEWLTNVLKT